MLAGAKTYSTAVDIWSLGCIMAELLSKKILFQGKGDIDQLKQIFDLLGNPTEQVWPGWTKLPNAAKVRHALWVACQPANCIVEQQALTEDPARSERCKIR